MHHDYVIYTYDHDGLLIRKQGNARWLRHSITQDRSMAFKKARVLHRSHKYHRIDVVRRQFSDNGPPTHSLLKSFYGSPIWGRVSNIFGFTERVRQIAAKQ